MSRRDFKGEERHCQPFLSPEKLELPQLGERVGTAHGVFLCPDWGQVTQHPSLQLDFLQQKVNFPVSIYVDLSFQSALLVWDALMFLPGTSVVT